jgi:sirohydrochlorin cobaltochelatase
MNSVALFLAAHGTQKNENSRESAERQAELIRRQHLFASVHAVFMEEDPRITTFHKMTSGRNVVVVPFFVSEGPHVKHDIPVLLGVPERVVRERLTNGQPPWRNPTEVKGKLVWYSRAAGTHPSMADAVVERVKEAANSVRGSGEC